MAVPRSSVAIIVGILLAMNCIGAQETSAPTELGKRDLWDSNFLNKRPPGKGKTLPKTNDDALVGITLWRLRPSNSNDDPGVRSLIHDDDQTREWTPERIQADTALHENDKVRLSIESARKGYLYVIDRDEYADGSKSDPYLIFPTLKLRGGLNAVSAGTLVEIPSQDDSPPYFRMRRSRPDQRAELLTILVTPRPIENLQIGLGRLQLDPSQVAAWDRRWRTTLHRLDAPEGGPGQTYTPTEKEAGSGHKMLTQDDPTPETLYRLDARPGVPLLIDLQLRIAK